MNFFNGDSPQDTAAVIGEISSQLNRGYGFLPFVGAGFSAPSGAPLVSELREYLQRCICISFGLDREGLDDGAVEPWNPRTDHWPPFIDRSRVFDSGAWVDVMFKEIQARRAAPSTPQHWTDLAMLSEGYGAMQEWRTALLFLSRLNRHPRNEGKPQGSWLGVPQQEVIDACFREALKDKYPALGHRMLAALAGALRLDIVLTTNFDDLLERSFEAARNPLEVFEVQLESKLPDWSSVSSVRALVKMHGGKSSLRADYTLDEAPSEEDKVRFLHYLLSSKGRAQWARGQRKGLDPKNHLLMIGFSAADRRIRDLIDYAWEKADPNAFRVYWICFSDDDVERIAALIQSSPYSFKGRTTLQHKNAGLFLLELYQSLRRTLPPLGSIFPSIARLTLPPLEPKWISDHIDAGDRRQAFESFNSALLDKLDEFDEDGVGQFKVVLAHSRPKVSGITSACSRVFRILESKGNKVCLWIDMNDISSADNLFEVLLEAIYYRLGFEDWIPSTVSSAMDGSMYQTDRRAREIDRLVRSVNKRWIVFLNGYETPGANTSDSQEADGNGWLDQFESRESSDRSEFEDQSDCAQDLTRLLRALCGSGSRMSVVLMCRNRSLFVPSDDEEKLTPVPVDLHSNARSEPFFVEEEIVLRAVTWAGKDGSKQRFLQALVLMQRPRHLATLWSPALTPLSEDLADRELRLSWIDELEGKGLIRRKPGGLIWIHSACRQMLRQILADKVNGTDITKDQFPVSLLDGWDPASQEATIHLELAEWYERVLDASESPAAVFEAAFHFCKAAVAFVTVPEYDFGRARSNIEAATSLLRTSAYLIQTHGYSRGSCRRLEMIAAIGIEILQAPGLSRPGEEHDGVGRAVALLWRQCAEVMRAVAREVGEDSKAYFRHRQVARLIGGESWIDVKKDKKLSGLASSLAETLNAKDGTHPDFVSEETFGSCDLFRWRRWSGMLAIASRSYGRATKIFEGLIGPFDEQGGDLWRKHRKETLHQSQRIELLRAIEQGAELLLLRSSATIRLRDHNRNGPFEDSKTLLEQVEHLVQRGIRLAKKVRDSDPSADAHEVMSANWCEARLLMHRSIAEMRRRSYWNAPLSVLDPMGILSDAEAKLRVSDARRTRSELAMIDLHRADVRICEAETTDLGGSTPLSLAGLEKEIARVLGSPLGIESWDFWRPYVDEEGLLKASALVADGLRFLNRAEPVLRDRRRNVWWTTWYFERKLRLIALSVAISAFDCGTPIPYLGLEAAMRLTETEADRLLNDAIRMIRVDVYRLATVLDAYLACICALEMRLKMDDLAAGGRRNVLPKRRRQMLANLRGGFEAFRDVSARREKIPEQYKDKGAPDEDVAAYVHSLSGRTRDFLGSPKVVEDLHWFDRDRLLTILAEHLAMESKEIRPATAWQAAESLVESGSLTKEHRRLLTWKTAIPPERLDALL